MGGKDAQKVGAVRDAEHELDNLIKCRVNYPGGSDEGRCSDYAVRLMVAMAEMSDIDPVRVIKTMPFSDEEAKKIADGWSPSVVRKNR